TSQCHDIRNPLYLIQDKQSQLNTAIDIQSYESLSRENVHTFNTVGFLPALYPERLGCPGFTKVHGTRFPYVVGAMANGIAMSEMVIEAAKIGCIGFFGAAGLGHEKVLQNIQHIQSQINPHQTNWGSNLIHSPHEPGLEEKVTEIYLH